MHNSNKNVRRGQKWEWRPRGAAEGQVWSPESRVRNMHSGALIVKEIFKGQELREKGQRSSSRRD